MLYTAVMLGHYYYMYYYLQWNSNIERYDSDCVWGVILSKQTVWGSPVHSFSLKHLCLSRLKLPYESWKFPCWWQVLRSLEETKFLVIAYSAHIDLWGLMFPGGSSTLPKMTCSLLYFIIVCTWRAHWCHFSFRVKPSN